MASNWSRADLKNHSQSRSVPAELIRSTQEMLARELGLSLSAFLRTTIKSAYRESLECSFGDLQREDTHSCFGSVMIRPGDHRLLLELEHSILFPLIGIALGAKPGGAIAVSRKPTELELQVVNILFRLVLAESYRAWSPLLKVQMETVALGIEQSPFRTFPLTDSVYVSRFDLIAGDSTGQLVLVMPQELVRKAVPEEPVRREVADPGATLEATLELVLPARVAMDVWLDGSQIRLCDLLQLQEGQIVKLDHPVERRALCTLNGKPTFTGQIVSTGAHRAFLLEDPAES